MVGETLSHYRVLEQLGQGGMGVIYRALDTRLGRSVALKVLRPEALGDPDRRRRFAREARAASALNHPNIVTIYEIDSDRGVDFIAMEHVEGEPLQRRITAARLPLEEALRHARGIASALAAAHAAGIVHRDVKPANVMVTRTGGIKVLDFGLAKLIEAAVLDSEEPTRAASLLTEHGVVLGTMAYMSPEQAEGRPVDARSDVFSFGVLLYELLCGQRPFEGPSHARLVSAILRDAPRPPRTLRRDLPPELERVVLRCLEKDPAQRYASAGELQEELALFEERLAARPWRPGPVVRRRAAAVAFALLLAASGAATWQWWRGSAARRARETTLPEIARLTEAGDYYGAFRLAREAERHIPGDAELRQMLDRVTLPISILTEPAGAEVFVKRYLTPDEAWELLGRSPLEDIRVPYALMRWRATREGFEAFEAAPIQAPVVQFTLDRPGARPPGMVRVAGGPVAVRGLAGMVGDYWLDQYEVTNRQFKEFVDKGGYQKREHWKERFVKDGRELSWEEAMAVFRDVTGRAGPATWEAGAHTEGRDEFPVGGVSWYEAVAYCQFVGKSLPTVYHWYQAGAAATPQFSDIIRFSNFGTQGPARVGANQGLGAYGTYDMAGNVKEWCWNETGGKRYILGGAWGEPTYMYEEVEARLPFERQATHGFRCARYAGEVERALLDPPPPRDFAKEKPVPDDVFDTIRSVYSYDRSDTKAVVEAVEDAPQWRKEKISFTAAAGNERVTAYLFLPKSPAPPYQTVAWFPGSGVFYARSSESLDTPFLYEFLPRSGRALVYPIYEGMYEGRIPAGLNRASSEWRDLVIRWSKDLGRTLDYLETRPEIDRDKLAFYGFSEGGIYGPLFTAIEKRFKTSILLAGGLDWGRVPAETEPLNFAPRVRVPVLMLNGRDDFLYPLEFSQRPLFRLFGVAEPHKRHVQLEGGHLPGRVGIVREVLDWLDKYLGPVKAS